MELTWCWIVLLVASFKTCFAHPYGVKGGSGSSVGATAGAIADAGAVSSAGGPGIESDSGSFSSSISKSTASSFAAATSGAFSFSGTGAGPFSGLGSNPFNFPLNGGGCASGKCENGGVKNLFGLSPNSAGLISGAGAGSFALSGASDSSKQSPCSGNCLNKELPRCQGSNCHYQPNSEDNQEPYDIPVNVGIKQENEPTERPCQSGNCNPSPNAFKDNTQDENEPPSPYKNSLRPGIPTSGPFNNNNSQKPNSNNQDVEPDNGVGSQNSYPTPHYPQTTQTMLNNPETFSPSLNTPFNNQQCESGKCKGNFAVYPNSDQGYNPSAPSLSDNAPPCSNGNCGGYGVKNTQPSKAFASPTLQISTVPNNPFPCSNGNCKSSPNKLYRPSLTSNYPANPSSDNEPVYKGGFGGPSGILKPNDYAAPRPLNKNPHDNTNQASQSPYYMPNMPGNYNSHPNLSDANSPNSPIPHIPHGSLPTGKPLSPHSTPQYPNYTPTDSTPKNGKSPSSYATAQNPSLPSPNEKPVKDPINSVKSSKPIQNIPVYGKATESDNEKPIPEYNSPDLMGPFSLAPSNALPAPSLLLETPKETFSQTADNDDLYSSNLPSSYNVPIIPNENTYKPEPSSDHRECTSPKCKSASQRPSTMEPALSSIPPKSPTNKPACAFGACNRPDEKTYSTPSYPNSKSKTPKEPSIATSTINVQLTTNLNDFSDDSPDFDVRYTSSNCINGDCVKNSAVGEPKTSNNLPPNNYPQPSKPGCLNGKCGGNIQGSPSGKPSTTPSPTLNNYPQPGCSDGQCVGSFPGSPSGKPYSPASPVLNNYPRPSNLGCSNGQCGGNFPNPPAAEKPYTSGGSNLNNYPQPSKTECPNGQCGGSFPGVPAEYPNNSASPSLNNYPQASIPGCSNGQCVGSFSNFPIDQPHTPGSVFPPTSKPYTPNNSPSNYYPQLSNPGCLNGQCDGSYQGSPAINSFTPASPAVNNYPIPSQPGCSNGQCGESYPNSQIGTPNSPSGVYPNNSPQIDHSGCSHGKCGGNIPMPSTGSNFYPGSPSLNNSPQTSPLGCAKGNCGESSPVSPTKDQYNPLPSFSCANGNCSPSKPCANGKCGPKIPNKPDYPVNPSTQDESRYGGGFGGPSGILKPNEYSAPLPSNPAHAVNVPTPSAPHHTPNKPGNQNLPLLPSLNSPNTNLPTVFDHSTNPENTDNGPSAHTIPQYPNVHPGQPHNSANVPNLASGSTPITDAGAYTGGFGGPPGYLKPFDDDKGVKPKKSEASLSTEPNHSGSMPSYGNGAFSAAGSYSGGSPNTNEPEGTVNPKEPACGGGCPKPGGYGASGSFGVSGSLGLAKGGFDALIGGLKGAAATAKSLAGSLSGPNGGAGSHGLSGSFAASSAVASSGAYKGGYGR